MELARVVNDHGLHANITIEIDIGVVNKIKSVSFDIVHNDGVFSTADMETVNITA